VRGEGVGERGNGCGVAALGGQQYPGLVDVDKQRDVVVAASGCGLVDRNAGDGAMSARARPWST
jgi:hypothetical protein